MSKKTKSSIKTSKKTSKKSEETTEEKLLNNSDDIKIRIVDQKVFDESFNNYLVLGISGKKINYVIMNTIRRVIMELVPTYGYDKNDINITKNTSIFNNDYMKLRISHFPVIGIINDFQTIERFVVLEYEANISTFDKKIENINEIEKRNNEEKLEKSQNLIMSINVKNTSNEVLCVTTNNEFTKFYYKASPITTPYLQDLLIVKLKPGEEFICNSTSSLNIGLKGANFLPTAVCVFTDPDEPNGEYILNLESLKQMSEFDIIIRACSIIIIKLNMFLDVFISKITEYKSESVNDEYNLENKTPNSLNNNTDSESNTESAIRNSTDEQLEQHRTKGIIKIENESHTFGNLLSRMFQDHPLIDFAGYKIDHLLIKELTIGYKTSGEDIVIIINDIITNTKLLFLSIIEKIKLLE